MSGRRLRRRFVALLATGLVVAGGAYALTELPKQSPARTAGVSAVYIDNLDVAATGGDKGVVLSYNTSPVKRNNGSIAAGTRMVITVTKPDASEITFKQSTDQDGRIRGQVYGAELNQDGIYGLELRVDGTSVSDSASFTIDERARLGANSQIFTGNNQIFRNTADSATAFTVQKADGTEVLGVDTTGGGEVRVTDLTATGTITAADFSGDGSNLTGVTADTLDGQDGSYYLDLGNATGTLAVARGGTGTGTVPTNGQLLIGNGTGYTVATPTGTGITVGTGAGTLSFSTVYGSGVNTAVQGDTTLTCPSGTGNLTGGGTSITLGSGGTCGALDTVNNPTFSGLVTGNAGGLFVAADLNGTALTARGVASQSADLIRAEDSSTTTLFSVGGAGGILSRRAGTGQSVFAGRITTDSVSRFNVLASGQLEWGPGGAGAIDTTLFRDTGNTLRTNGTFLVGSNISFDTDIKVARGAATDVVFASDTAADSFDRFRIMADGKQEWGPGNGARDTTLYRDAAGNLLKTDDAFVAAVGSTNPGAFDRLTNDGTIVSLRQDGTEEGTISVSGTTVSYNAFTGSHYADAQESIDEGMLVTLTGTNGRLGDRPDSEVLYGVKRATKANDAGIMGAYLSVLNPKTAKNENRPESAANPSLVMAVGNGDVWVADNGKNLNPGDNLISSDIAGHAMADTGEYPVSHVVAKVAEPTDWDAVDETVDADGRDVKHRKVSVFFTQFDKPNRGGVEDLREVEERVERLEAKLDELAGGAALPSLPEVTASPAPSPGSPDALSQSIAELRTEAIAADKEHDAENDERFERLERQLSAIAAVVRSREVTGSEGTNRSILGDMGLYATDPPDGSGTVDGVTGDPTKGDGFDAKRTAKGIYAITFADARPRVPSPTVTPKDPNGVVICSVHDVTEEGFAVKCQDVQGRGVDQEFAFRAW
ncbi:MAG TPA: hypothetical protein VIF43_03770 [Patescibacteria group bacterium]